MTGPSQQTDVTIGDMNKHASRVTELGNQLKAAGATGSNVDLGVQTFGVIGQAFSVGVRSSISSTGDAIKALSTTFDTISNELKECATDYRNTDDDNKVMFKIED